jgi:4'-phosphopantetheinyl transferase
MLWLGGEARQWAQVSDAQLDLSHVNSLPRALSLCVMPARRHPCANLAQVMASANPFEIRVLRCAAAPSLSERTALLAALLPDEDVHRKRFYRAEDADRFLVGRGTLRRELGRMLGIAPQDVILETGPHGKLHPRGGACHVNVSHSGDVVLVAVTTGAEVGVDVERINAAFVDRPLMETSFTRREIEEIDRLPQALHVEAFFHTWTSRESIMKAVGLGFHLPRDEFDVSVDPRASPALLAMRMPSLMTRTLSLVSIPVPIDHHAMLAVEADSSAFTVSLVDVG